MRKEVRLLVVPGHTLAKVDFPLSSLVNLQKILFDEEKAAYNQAISQSTRFDDLHDELAQYVSVKVVYLLDLYLYKSLSFLYQFLYVLAYRWISSFLCDRKTLTYFGQGGN
jgi:hypothetical protein